MTFVVSKYVYMNNHLTIGLLAFECGGGMVYNECGSGINRKCGEQEDYPTFCVEGCYCPIGKVEHNGECISEKSCPCLYNDEEFPEGSSVQQDCNTW